MQKEINIVIVRSMQLNINLQLFMCFIEFPRIEKASYLYLQVIAHNNAIALKDEISSVMRNFVCSYTKKHTLPLRVISAFGVVAYVCS